LVSHPHSIVVTAADGRVTLGGPILAREVDGLLALVRRVRGVDAVENRLEVHQQAGTVPGLQGGRTRPAARPELLQAQWTPTPRPLAGAAGGALVAYGAKRRDLLGASCCALGAGFIARGATNKPVARLTGVGAGHRAVDVQKAINIAAPVEQVFDFWANVENFPHFMSRVREVRHLGEGHSRWIVEGPAGSTVEWTATITD